LRGPIARGGGISALGRERDSDRRNHPHKAASERAPPRRRYCRRRRAWLAVGRWAGVRGPMRALLCWRAPARALLSCHGRRRRCSRHLSSGGAAKRCRAWSKGFRAWGL